MGGTATGLFNRTMSKNKWNTKTYDRIYINVKRDKPNGKSSEKERLKELAEAQGKSTARYIVDAINAYAGETIISVLDNESKKKKTE